MDRINRLPRYSLQARGTEAVKIIYEGKTLGVFDREGLWTEYRKTTEPNDPALRYVIERAIERFEGKAPEYRESGSITKRGPGALQQVKPGSYPINPGPLPRRKKSFIGRILARLGIRF